MSEPPRKLKKRQKLCYNCEGEIDLEVIVCPFCAADLREEKPEQGRISFGEPQRSSGSAERFMQERLGRERFEQERLSQARLDSDAHPQTKTPEDDPSPPSHAGAASPIDCFPENETEKLGEAASEQNFLAPTVLFTLGIQLVLIGLLMLLFSHKGTIHLTWNASWWFMYCIVGFPFLYFGYRSISKL